MSCSTSSQICGSWYLPRFLFRDGSLTLMNMASFMVLVKLWDSLSMMEKLSSFMGWPVVHWWDGKDLWGQVQRTFRSPFPYPQPYQHHRSSHQAGQFPHHGQGVPGCHQDHKGGHVHQSQWPIPKTVTWTNITATYLEWSTAGHAGSPFTVTPWLQLVPHGPISHTIWGYMHIILVSMVLLGVPASTPYNF